MTVAGIMSGTSLDGIDVAIVDIRGRRVETVGFTSTPYPAALRDAILAVSNATTHTSAISRLNYQLAERYAQAVRRTVRRFGAVDLIGCHGQTVYHEGRSNTLQLGEPAVLAERTGVTVISNFRARDIAVGGQGAPLVPYVDYLLFRHPRRTRVALNIGGIANITVLPAGAGPGDVAAFDTGPGNMVIDALAKEYSRGKLACDRGGRIAASGRVNSGLLGELLRDSYYRRPHPKSAGREQYGAEFLARLKASGLPLRDLIATATVLTAATIALGVRRAGALPAELIASGGGVHNPGIMHHLAALLPEAAIATSTAYGVDADAKEAVAFAVLAYETWRGHTSNLPAATGASRAVVLGSITPYGVRPQAARSGG
ncbi:MAG: anhydro-N-acetylmuramic acid kinase [Acidobacteriota bacterium]|nr:anhydro-N-acetylmuramic acid kinase [Acidobacteriota bacterium]